MIIVKLDTTSDRTGEILDIVTSLQRGKGEIFARQANDWERNQLKAAFQDAQVTFRCLPDDTIAVKQIAFPNAAVHRAEIIKDWLQNTASKIECVIR